MIANNELLSELDRIAGMTSMEVGAELRRLGTQPLTELPKEISSLLRQVTCAKDSAHPNRRTQAFFDSITKFFRRANIDYAYRLAMLFAAVVFAFCFPISIEYLAVKFDSAFLSEPRNTRCEHNTSCNDLNEPVAIQSVLPSDNTTEARRIMGREAKGSVATAKTAIRSLRRQTVERMTNDLHTESKTIAYLHHPLKFVATASYIDHAAYVATAYSLHGRTADGRMVSRGLIAADPRVIPLGSRIKLDHPGWTGEYLVADSGGAVRGKRIDIWTPSQDEAIRFGRRTVQLTVLSYGVSKHKRSSKRGIRNPS